MNRRARLQLIGPMAMFAGSLAAEAASQAMASAPSSPTLWYLCREWFGPFQGSRNVLEAGFDVGQWQLLLVGLPLASMAWCGFVFGRRLLLGVAANLNLVYVSFLVCMCCACWLPVGHAETMRTPTWIELLVGALLLGLSLFSAAISHVDYLRAIRNEATWSPTSFLPTSSS
jgi:hypothetical protein